MPIYTFVCDNEECRHEREVLIKHSELAAHLEWCEACAWETDDVGVATAADDHGDGRVTDLPTGGSTRRYRYECLMRWRGVEGGQPVRPQGKYRFQLSTRSGGYVTPPNTKNRSDS